MSFLEVANSPIMFVTCLAVVLIVLIQSVIFICVAWKQGCEVGIDKGTMKKVMTNSAIFSVIPSLPILIMLMVLTVPLGRFFPWLRLSVVGSAAYESMAANMAATGSGLESLTDPGMTGSIFTSAMLVMSVGIIWGMLFNIFFMKSLDKFTKRAKTSGSRFVPVLSAALFLALLSVLSMPFAANSAKPVGIITFIASAVVALLCSRIAKTTKISAIGEFSLPISLLSGMIVATLCDKIVT